MKTRMVGVKGFMALVLWWWGAVNLALEKRERVTTGFNKKFVNLPVGE